MPSNLPSSYLHPSSKKPFELPKSETEQQQAKPSGEPGITTLLAALALALSLLSFYGAYFMEKPLSPHQKEQLKGIADDLRALQNRDIVLSAPVSTTINLDRSYPIKDLFPQEFEIPLKFVIPINTQLVGISTTGQPVQFRVQEQVPIQVTVPISSATAFGNHTIRIKKEIPVDVRFTSSIKVKTAYGQDLNKIIDRLEEIANK